MASWPEVRECHMLAGEADFPAPDRRHGLGRLSALPDHPADLGAQCQPCQIGAGDPQRKAEPGVPIDAEPLSGASAAK